MPSCDPLGASSCASPSHGPDAPQLTTIDADRAASCRLPWMTFGANARLGEAAVGLGEPAGAEPLPELPPEPDEEDEDEDEDEEDEEDEDDDELEEAQGKPTEHTPITS